MQLDLKVLSCHVVSRGSGSGQLVAWITPGIGHGNSDSVDVAAPLSGGKY